MPPSALPGLRPELNRPSGPCGFSRGNSLRLLRLPGLRPENNRPSRSREFFPKKAPRREPGGLRVTRRPVCHHNWARPTTRRPHACARGFFMAGGASMPPAALPGLRPAARASRLAFANTPFTIKAHRREQVGRRVAIRPVCHHNQAPQQPAVPTLARGASRLSRHMEPGCAQDEETAALL